MQVRWTNFQLYSVKFPDDIVPEIVIIFRTIAYILQTYCSFEPPCNLRNYIPLHPVTLKPLQNQSGPFKLGVKDKFNTP